MLHSVRTAERFNDLWLLGGVNDLWRVYCKPKRKIITI